MSLRILSSMRTSGTARKRGRNTVAIADDEQQPDEPEERKQEVSALATNSRRKLSLPSHIPLPSSWSDFAKSAFLSSISMAHRAMTWTQSWCVNSTIARLRLTAENQQLHVEVAMLREELRIKDARLLRIPASQRPHYAPTERLAILALKTSRAWSHAQAARAFLVTDATIASWLARVDEHGTDALVKLQHPVNRFPEFVAALARELKTLCPTWDADASRSPSPRRDYTWPPPPSAGCSIATPRLRHRSRHRQPLRPRWMSR
ncbi:MAG: hypothetical protein QM784_10400 [Polyangiaceae bacterium]